MKIGTRSEMHQMDTLAMTQYGIPSLLLMEHAAYGVFNQLKERQEQTVLIICGPGNNGGDGLALARQLVTWSHKKVEVILAVPPEKLSSDGQTYYAICKKLNLPIHQWQSIEAIQPKQLMQADMIIDALFGTGLTRDVTGFYKTLIEAINTYRRGTVVSLDLPSGIACDTGVIKGVAVEADETFTFQWSKVGLCVYPGVLYAGKITCIDIGIPKRLQAALPTRYESTEILDAQAMLPKRPMRSNKGDYGKVLLIGGSKEMSGAITLAAQAAMKAGAGTVTLVVPDVIQDRVASCCIDAMTVGLMSDEGHFGIGACEWLEKNLERFDVVAVGPGMGRSEAIEHLINCILKKEIPCIIDADGLYPLNKLLSGIKNRQAPILLTPHPKEFSRLSGLSVTQILANPLDSLEDFVKATKVHAILKLERTLVATGTKVFINTTGNPALAKGGSGDVLTGLIAGIYGWSGSVETALRLGVYMHGATADELCHKTGSYSLQPSQLSEGIESIFRKLENK